MRLLKGCSAPRLLLLLLVALRNVRHEHVHDDWPSILMADAFVIKPTSRHKYQRALSSLRSEIRRQSNAPARGKERVASRKTKASIAKDTFPMLLKQAQKSVEARKELTQSECDNLLEASGNQDARLDSILEVIQQQQEPQQVQATHRYCIQWCHKSANAKASLRILQAMEQTQTFKDANDISLVVKTVCRANKNERGIWKSTTGLIQTHDDLELSAYDAYLSCLTYDGLWKESVRLLRQMQSGRTKPTLSTYTVVIDCCLFCNQGEQAGQLLVASVRHGIRPTVQLFERVVTGLSRKMQWRKALQLVEMMDELKLQKTLGLYNSLLMATAKSGESIQAKNLLQRMKRDNIQPNTYSYNFVISACANYRNWKDALLVFDQCLREPGVSPDIYTYTNAIRACAKGGNADRAMSLLQVAEDIKLPVDAYCYTAAIEACAKVKRWKKALELLDKMERQGIAPTEVTYSVTITACGNGGHWEKALELLDVMAEKNMKINIITYNAAIAALSKAAKAGRGSHGDKELWNIALQLLDRMNADGIELDGFSYSSAISCCGAYGEWIKALELFEAMQSGGARTQPNKIAYTAAMSSCAKAGQYEHAGRLFQQMKDQGLLPDRVAYNTLFSAYRVAGEGELAFTLWKELVGGSSLDVSPDLITLHEAIGAMNGTEMRDNVDVVFGEAVCRGIIFDANSFDTSWEIDLTKMTLSVARAACRHVFRRVTEMSRTGMEIEDLVFITGVGRNHDADHPSLREFVRDILLTDFVPPVASYIPERASGTVVVDKAMVLTWTSNQL